MRAERSAFGLEPERLQAPHDFLLHLTEHISTVRKTDPNHTSGAGGRKHAAVTESKPERSHGKRPLHCGDERRGRLVVDLPNEDQGQMQILGRDPAGVEPGSSKPLSEIRRHASGRGSYRFIELHGHKQTHQAIIRRRRSRAACVD